MLKFFVTVSFVILASGCATKEGILLSTSKPTKADVGEFNRRNSQPSTGAVSSVTVSKDVVTTSLLPDVPGPKIIVIGNVMALTVFDEPTLNKRYDNYLKKLAGKPAAFSREWYLSASSGQTSVKYSGVTGIYTRFYRAEIPKDLLRQISFASTFGTFMAGTSADLVAVQVLPGYGSWITRVLCSEKDPNYSACEQEYQHGVYQSSDGREIDTNLKLIEGGAVIDPISFKRFVGTTPQSPASANSTASPQAGLVQAASARAPSSLPVSSLAVPVAAPQRDEAVQLSKLKELHDKGLITQEEYERKRKEILDRL